jgi:hypothetical protein
MRQLTLASGLCLLLTGCAELFPHPRPDATGLVNVTCSAYERSGQLQACEQSALDACDGPATLLDASYTPAPFNVKKNAPDSELSSVRARYQCLPR